MGSIWKLVLMSAAALAMGSLSSCSHPRTPLPAQSPPATPKFRDVSRESGVDFQHTNGASPEKYLISIVGSGTGVLDYDGDGKMDLFFVNGRPLSGAAKAPPTLHLYRNLGRTPLRFRDVTREAGLAVTLFGMGCAVGDYDNDGWPDLYVSAVLGPGRLFHNNHGRFVDVTAKAGVGNPDHWGTGCVWLDYDRDGKLDLYVANYVRYRTLADDVPCYVRNHQRSFCVPVAYKGSCGVLYRNLGANGGETRFADATAAAGLVDDKQKALGVAVADVDDNGWPDLLVANDTVPNRCFLNEAGKFHEGAVEAGLAFGPNGTVRAGMGIDAADWRNDGLQTVAISYFAKESIGFYVQTGPGQLFFNDDSSNLGIAAPSAPYLGFGIHFLDWDNDGYEDLCGVNGHIRDDIQSLEPDQRFAQPALLFRNRRGTGFEDVTGSAGEPLTTPAVRRGLAVADLDDDGRIDLIATRNGGRAEIWRNETDPPGHSLTLRLRGTKSNRDAIGARVAVQVGERKLTRWVRSGGGYLSESDRRLHFGLGAAASADEIVVRWPLGLTERFPGAATVGAGRVVTLVEGSGGKLR